MSTTQNHKHFSVLKDEVWTFIPEQCRVIVDGTVWHGWHTSHFVHLCSLHGYPLQRLVAIDRDAQMLKRAKWYVEQEHTLPFPIDWVWWRYDDVDKYLNESLVYRADFVLLDLWVNLSHFVEWDRWFSIKHDGPLDMRFDTTADKTAATVLQSISYDECVSILQIYGDFSPRYSAYLAKEIRDQRKKYRRETTNELVSFLRDIWMWTQKIAVFFQVLRIHVNKELDHLLSFLEKVPDIMSPWGRCAIITYHSIEDRIVKEAFKKYTAEGKWSLMNKKVIVPSDAEIKSNRPSRSAKLRVWEAFT